MTTMLEYKPKHQLDPDRLKFHRRAAIYYTVASVVLLLALSLAFAPDEDSSSSSTPSNNDNKYSIHRWLEEANNDDDTNKDYTTESCRYIYDIVPDAGVNQCRFARTCNGGDGVWAPFVFCSQSMSTTMLFVLISPVLIIWMVTLFRLLGSTAEDYFSPSLEMFSTKLGLPPRFAGVSLLALGNGAADVSATMSAIANDPDTGYQFSLGALTGAAMLVGGVVAGLVVLVAGGVPCRGALVRDVLSLLITVLVVWKQLANGVITAATTSLFLSMYGLFVCLVLVADIYHRAVVIPRIRAANDAAEVQRQLDQEGMIREEANLNVASSGSPRNIVSAPSALDRAMAALSNYDTPNERFGPTPAPNRTDSTRTDSQSSGLGWGIESNQIDPNDDQPIVLHGQHGLLHHGPVRQHLQHRENNANEGEGYTLVEDHVDPRICIDDTSMGFAASNWSGAWHDGKAEVIEHLIECYRDIVDDEEANRFEKFLMFCELPFTIFRKVGT
jgi:Ca2+/Na+ antiporter